MLVLFPLEIIKRETDRKTKSWDSFCFIDRTCSNSHLKNIIRKTCPAVFAGSSSMFLGNFRGYFLTRNSQIHPYHTIPVRRSIRKGIAVIVGSPLLFLIEPQKKSGRYTYLSNSALAISIWQTLPFFAFRWHTSTRKPIHSTIP